MAYEALYRRYRPSRFADAFFGQDHVVAALRNAVEGDRVGHAYLFSGPRGTGKTTSARILAKALNCTDLQGGEPCDACDSCLSFQSGGSYDLHELDAASNNGVDAMRDLIGKVALGSPGRNKVYILDEVHMLSSGAENALLKTLEEPPPHVTFVLCTTEPNKVVPTIRSRTQHLEFSLLTESQVGELVDYVVSDAALEITPEDRSYVVRAGGGSARDTLSALDQVVAAGGAPQGGEHLEALFQALVDRDAGAALAAIDGALHAGRDAATVATSLLHELRTTFLAAMRADLGHLADAERSQAEIRAAAMSPARVTRAIEVIGTSVIEMRQAPDPRVDLEVAIMRLTRADLDTDPAALVERLAAIESQLAGGAPIAAPAPAAAPAPGPTAEAPAPVAQPAPAEVVTPPQQPAPVDYAEPEQSYQPEQNYATEQQPAAAPGSSQGSAPSVGRRGADIVRAALAEQENTQAEAPSAPASDAPAPAEAAAPPAAAPPAGAPPAASAGKTLADVRRERQAAAAAGNTPATADTETVEANAAARRERQAAAQAAPQQPAAAPTPLEQQAPAPEPAPAPAPASAPASGGGLPTLEELNAVWQPMLESMSGRVRSRFSAGHFMETGADTLNFGLPNPVHRDRCEEIRDEVDHALAAKFGRPVPLALVVDETEEEPDFFAAPPSGGAGVVDEAVAYEEETVDVHDLVDATGDVPSAEDRVLATFEGSTLVEDPPTPHLDR